MAQMIIPPKKKKKINSIAVSLYIYWLVLVIWQNFFSYDKDSNLSMLIKMGLLIYLCWCFIRGDPGVKSSRFILWSVFAVFCMLSMLISGESFLGGNMIFYLFPMIFSLLTMVIRADYTIDRKQFLLFLRLVILTVSYMAIYCVISQWTRFVYFFKLTKAYGYEISSFLSSNHEYGMYLVFGITSVIFCYQNTDSIPKHIIYVLLLALFGVNLILTLSRTSYMAGAVIILVFVMTSKAVGTRRWFIFAVVVFVILIFALPNGTDFFEKILLKENNDAGRIEMWDSALDKFREGNLLHRLFGYGNSEIYQFTKENFRHASVHNTYLQVLLVWGAIGFVFIISATVCSMISALRLFRYDRNLAAVFFALVLSQIAFMFTNTACLFQSVIDSYMLTVFSLVVPKYVFNAIIEGKYYPEKNTDTSLPQPQALTL